MSNMSQRTYYLLEALSVQFFRDQMGFPHADFGSRLPKNERNHQLGRNSGLNRFGVRWINISMQTISNIDETIR